MNNFTIYSHSQFYLGDLCYALDDDIYDNDWGKVHNYKDGAYTVPNTNLQYAMVGTAHGDGEYEGTDNHTYPVDAGIIGIADIELCTKDFDEYDGRVISFVGEVSISRDDEIITVEYGNKVIRINTGWDY